ncbi:hypothetical protein KR093_006182 [Drosophila rubida]|uniref:Uncharacterized protein n=1 Tax=Drosophila rubida TaxID=30044 RepID=A0AAD4K861_9MUSC|nr:hypothetical protein KR093_006182 [Drosophila rubida]
MIYLQWCCFCVDLRIGAFIVAISDIVMDLFFGAFILIFGESGEPDLCHKLFCVFMLFHLISAILLFLGTLWVSTQSGIVCELRLNGFFQLRPSCMLMYIILTLVKILAMVILVISDIILVIWLPVIILYVIMFVVGIYYWLVVYSFYAALGGDLFI